MKAEKIPISVIILTKNEEKAITECVLSVQKFSQVVIVDSLSSDRTVEIAKSLGAEILEFLWNGDYPKKKQWALAIINLVQDYDRYVINCESNRELLSWRHVSQVWVRTLLEDWN